MTIVRQPPNEPKGAVHFGRAGSEGPGTLGSRLNIRHVRVEQRSTRLRDLGLS